MIDAIETDVSDAEDKEVVEQPKSQNELRAEKLNEISAQANGGEIEAEPEITIVAEDATEEIETAEAVEEPEANALDPLEALGIYQDGDGNYVTTMKVNGIEKEIPIDQIKPVLQKDIAGDLKLQTATERLREVEEREKRLSSMERELKAKPEPSKDAHRDITAGLNQFLEGNTEKAAELLAKAQPAPTLDIDAVRETVKQEMTEAEAKKQQDAWDKSAQEGRATFEKDFKELANSPELFAVVNAKTSEFMTRQKQGDPDYINLTPSQMIQKAAEETQSWIKPQETTRDERKANLKPVPQTKDEAFKKPKKAEVDMSAKAKIARMRQGRAVA